MHRDPQKSFVPARNRFPIRQIDFSPQPPLPNTSLFQGRNRETGRGPLFGYTMCLTVNAGDSLDDDWVTLETLASVRSVIAERVANHNATGVLATVADVKSAARIWKKRSPSFSHFRKMKTMGEEIELEIKKSLRNGVSCGGSGQMTFLMRSYTIYTV